MMKTPRFTRIWTLTWGAALVVITAAGAAIGGYTPPGGGSGTTTVAGNVAVTNTPTVSVSGVAQVAVSNTPNVVAVNTPVSTAIDAGTKVTVTTASAVVVAANAARTAWCVVAQTDNFHDVYLSLSGTATSSAVQLKAKDSYCEQGGGAVPVYSGAVAVITTYGNAVVYTTSR